MKPSLCYIVQTHIEAARNQIGYWKNNIIYCIILYIFWIYFLVSHGLPSSTIDRTVGGIPAQKKSWDQVYCRFWLPVDVHLLQPTPKQNINFRLFGSDGWMAVGSETCYFFSGSNIRPRRKMLDEVLSEMPSCLALAYGDAQNCSIGPQVERVFRKVLCQVISRACFYSKPRSGRVFWNQQASGPGGCWPDVGFWPSSWTRWPRPVQPWLLLSSVGESADIRWVF